MPGTPPFLREASDTPSFSCTGPLRKIGVVLRVQAAQLQTSSPTPVHTCSVQQADPNLAEMAAKDSLKWTFGLLNSANRYLTAETFQCKVTANGTTMKQKQIWTLRRQGEGGHVALQSHAGKYLSIDRDGKVSAGATEVGPDETLTLETKPDGKVAVKSSYGRYLGGSGENISGFDQTCEAINLFTIHLAMHPQINLYNVCRKKFCRLADEEIVCDELIPWGSDALIILEFHGGKYALRAANGKLLHRDGSLVNELSNDTLYTIVFRDAQVAFRDRHGKFLTAVGGVARMQSRKESIGKDELFLLMDSHPQISLTACNKKLVSIRDGMEVRANQAQDNISDAEIFQMEAVDRTDRSGNCKWAFRGNNNKYWSANPGITADADNATEKNEFIVEWLGPMIALKAASNGKYISVKSNGKMSAESTELTDECKFVFDFINRPLLVLRGCYGFVGVKGGSGVLECNRSQYDLFRVTCTNGTFNIQGSNGKYMAVDGDENITITSDSAYNFHFELRAHTHMVIVAENGKFLMGAQNGGFTAKGSTISNTTLWEY